MGEVERTLRRRQREAAAQQADGRRAADARDQAAQHALIREVEALVPAALAGLERAGWPGGRLLHVPRFLVAKQIAGWPAGYFHHRHGEKPGGLRAPIYLLRDGRWMAGDHAKPGTFSSVALSHVSRRDRPWTLLLRHPLPLGVAGDLRRLAELPAQQPAASEVGS